MFSEGLQINKVTKHIPIKSGHVTLYKNKTGVLS